MSNLLVIPAPEARVVLVQVQTAHQLIAKVLSGDGDGQDMELWGSLLTLLNRLEASALQAVLHPAR